MPIELSYLVASVAILMLMIIVEAVIGNGQYKTSDLLGPRDDLPPATGAMGRAKRATQNMMEALMMFAPLILVAAYTDNLNRWTAIGAALFFWARLLYAPSYWLGVKYARSLIWAVGLVGTLMVFFQILPFIGAN